MDRRKRLFLIDGYALIYRAFFAMISRPLTTSRGENTSAAWGITNFLLRLSAKHRPEYLAWVHDKGTSFRHETYPAYKATRQKLDAELQQDFDRSVERIVQLLAAFRVRLVEVEGYEADDVIATLAASAPPLGVDAVIVSGDKDFYQLLGPYVSLLNPGRGGPAAVEEELVSLANAGERLGVRPEQTVDYLALVGDAADNVPGVRGVGEKTARKLLLSFGTLDEVLARADELPSQRLREALHAEAERARLSRQLVTLQRDVPVALDLPALALREPDWPVLLPLLSELEFHSLVRSLSSEAEPPRPSARYEVADTPELVAEVVRRARAATAVALDVETTSLDPMRAELVGLSVAVEPGVAWYLPFLHREEGGILGGGEPRNLPPLTEPALAPLRELLADPAVPKTGHNIKFDWLVVRRAGVELAGVVFDSMIASFLVDPGRRSHGLDALALDHFNVRLRSYGELVGRGKTQRSFPEVPIPDAARYCCADSDYALRLMELLQPMLDDHGLTPLFRDIELPLIRVLVDMEWEGIGIDDPTFAALAADLKAQLVALERAICAAAGTEFNVQSTPQLRHILFEKLQLPVLKKTKTGPSTDAEVLEELAAMGHEAPRLLLEFREVSKLLSTYVEVLPARVNPATGRIHTSFNQIGAATGRLSSSEPNLQNIPVRSARGEAIRAGFVPRPGARFVAADYSQIELRLLAHLSGDPAFVAAFRSGEDIHRQTAALIFGVDPVAVTPEMRGRAKTINFATIYGQGPHALSRQLGISREEARRFIATYFERFAGVRAYLDDQVAFARKNGYVETLLGRRRYIPEIQDASHTVRAFGERLAANSPIQGSAADLIKIAMVHLAAALRASFRARLLLQVHDELVVEAPEAELDAVVVLVREKMESAATLSVPLVVSVGIGANWLAAKVA